MSVSVPKSEAMRVVLFRLRLIFPETVLLPMLARAPCATMKPCGAPWLPGLGATPVVPKPLRERLRVIVAPAVAPKPPKPREAERSKVPPPTLPSPPTITVLEPTPSALLPAMTTVPLATKSCPAKLFAELARKMVPLPDLTKAPRLAAPPSARRPLKVVELLSPPTLRIPPERLTVPVPASEPMLSLKPARARVAPVATVTAELTPKALFLMPACKVPALT